MQTVTSALAHARERAEIDQLVTRMFALVAEGVTAATDAFLAGDRATARAVAAADQHVDALLRELEAVVEHRLTARPSPEPEEVRFLISVLRIAPELERSGDLIEHIAMRTPQGLAEGLTGRARCLLHDMGRLAQLLWHETAEAYGAIDAAVLADLDELDDVLDDLHVELTTELAARPCSVPAAIELGLVARFYERLGDHAVNVARRAAWSSRA